MSALGRSIHVRGKGSAHGSIAGLYSSTSLFCLSAGAGIRKGIVMTDRTERAPCAFRLNFEQQKKRAKDLLSAVKSGDVGALARVAAVREGADPAKL